MTNKLSRGSVCVETEKMKKSPNGNSLCDCFVSYSYSTCVSAFVTHLLFLSSLSHALFLLPFSCSPLLVSLPSLQPNNPQHPSSFPPSEERVAPLEVSRSKLSRHLQGLVFRCHKCTFTCSSDQALQLHLQKHAEIKPYQCQLCYYDSSRRSQLEEHLRLEHKVG